MKTREARLSISILDYVSYIEKQIEKGDKDSIIKTPFPQLNKMLGGGLRGLACIGAAPGLGKSAMAQQIAIYTATKSTMPVIYVDLEHSIEFLTLRFLSSITSKTIESVKECIAQKTLKLSPLLKLLTLLPGGKIVTEDIINSINNLAYENTTTFIVIDSVQKLPIIPGTTPRESANIWIREIEYIKNNFPVVILVISELSRGEGGKNYTHPGLGSLKECVTWDTLVTMASGSRKRISEIEKGDLVQSFDEKSGCFIPTIVKNVWNRGIKQTYEVKLKTGRVIRATDNHQLYGDNGWLSVENLKVGDLVGIPIMEWWGEHDLNWDEVVSVKKCEMEEVWDLQIEGYPNFLANNILVHNSGDLEYTFEQVLLLSQISGSDMYRLNLVKNRFGPSGEVKSAIYSQENFRYWHWEEVLVE